MPRDADKRIRPPSIAAHLRKIRGMDAAEKNSLVRIGALCDALFEQRQITNSATNKARSLAEDVPQPLNVVATAIVGGVEITWNEVDYSKFDTYEVQVSDSSTFADPTTRTVTNNRVVFQGISGANYCRVRVLSQAGTVSRWSSPLLGSFTVAEYNYDTDTDFDEPENCCRVGPGAPPTLFGDAITFDAVGDRVFTMVGGAIGPGPISFEDESGSYSSTNRDQINFVLQQNSTTNLQGGVVGLPTDFNDGFYDDQSREYIIPSGSFCHMFYTQDILEDSILDIIFHTYFKNPHEQTGVVNQASMSHIKH